MVPEESAKAGCCRWVSGSERSLSKSHCPKADLLVPANCSAAQCPLSPPKRQKADWQVTTRGVMPDVLVA